MDYVRRRLPGGHRGAESLAGEIVFMGVFSRLSSERKCEIGGVAVLSVTAVLFLALATDRYQGETSRSITDLGAGGSMLAGALYLLLGKAAHVIYVLTGAWGVMLLRHQPLDRVWTRLLGFFLLTAATAGFLEIAFDNGRDPGGMVGGFVVYLFQDMFGTGGTIVITLTAAIVGMLLATEFLFVRLLHWCWSTLLLMIRSIEEMRQEVAASMAARRERKEREAKVITVKPEMTRATPGDKETTADEPARSRLSVFKEVLALFSSKKRKVRSAVARVRRAHMGDADEAADVSRVSITGSLAPAEGEPGSNRGTRGQRRRQRRRRYGAIGVRG